VATRIGLAPPERQELGSLERCLLNGLVGIRSGVYNHGVPEPVELCLMWRVPGMPMESPAVRP
jgi:hypothetical protein